MDSSILENRDYTLIVDKSQSMSTQDQPDGKSRWEAVAESTLAVAQKCEQYDPDGITVYLFSSRFRRYDQVTSAKVKQVFEENFPAGTSNLAEVLKDALDNYLTRKAAGQTKPNGETLIVITDGEPDDRKAVMELIIDASCQLDRDEELAISFIQVGSDRQTTEFLKALDDRMQSVGAKFDIVDTMTMETLQGMNLKDVLMNAITD